VESKECDFPFKSAVGALQWAVTCARPDLAHSVNTLARAGGKKCTLAMQKQARFVFRYCLKSRDYSIGYSPEAEAQFNAEYKEVTKSPENDSLSKQSLEHVEKPVHVFTDASFGTEYKTMKSISGIVVYLHGCPIAWRSKVQTLLTTCTTQSEYVAMADAIEFSSTVYGLKNFLLGLNTEASAPDGPLWTDNRGAALIARKGVLNRDEIKQASRHIALRFASVLSHADRVFWTPTDLQKGDALTKSSNSKAIWNICPWFNTHVPSLDKEEDYEEDETEVFYSSINFEFLRRSLAKPTTTIDAMLAMTWL
jgi:hypothetical protein